MTGDDAPDDAEAGDANLTEKINQTNVDKRIASLEAAYDEVPVTEETFELSPDEYADVFAATRGTGYSGNSVVLVTRDGTDFPELSDQIPDQAASDTRDRVLLVLGRGADMWALPGGGKGDEYESVQGTAVRRVNEQTGIRCTVTGVAEVVHSKYYPDTDAQGSVHTLDIYLKAEYKKGSLDVDESELVGAAWFAKSPERLTPGAEEQFGAFLDDE